MEIELETDDKDYFHNYELYLKNIHGDDDETDEEDDDLPIQLQYGLFKKPEKVDECLLLYQNQYKTYNFYAEKFKGDYSNIPGFDKVIIQMSQNSKSPLEEYDERILEPRF